MARLEIEFLDVASADISEAVEWYRQNTTAKVARKLALSLGNALDRIALFPKGYPIFSDSVRRVGLRGFHYWLYYTELGGRIVVVALYHTKTDPGTYSARIQ